MEPTEVRKYFNKAKRYYKIIWYCFIWILAYSQLSKLISPLTNGILSAILMVFPFLGICALVPIGLVYIVKSYTNKEPFHRYRMLYLIGYLFFLLVILVFVFAIIGDVKKYGIYR